MAVLDERAGEIVIRLVYDGPPEAGKTTSLRALAASLSQPTYTPQEDARGRTLYFDWMEYAGGRFEGYRIRCQIVSVPGQMSLLHRRRRLLVDADAVVFVGDSTPEGYERSLEYLDQLHALLIRVPGPTVGVVFQINKRDVPDAIDLGDVRSRLAETRLPVGVVESIALDGTGIREAFVYGVRLALDRVRELMSDRSLASQSAEPDAAGRLLRALRDEDDGQAPAPPIAIATSEDSAAAALLREVLEREASPDERPGDPIAIEDGVPKPPDASVPSGAIWPPVEGRAILYEVAALARESVRMSNGAWVSALGTGWRVVSGDGASFRSIDQGRSALIQWARLHTASAGSISPRRCIVLADAGDGSWRLWQIVRAEDSLREIIARALEEEAGDELVHRICWAAQLLLEAEERLSQASFALSCSLDTIGTHDARAVYIGLMPDIGSEPLAHAPRRLSAYALLKNELEPLVLPQLGDRHRELSLALARAPRQFMHSDVIFSTVTGLLSTHETGARGSA
jgi:signal recognition particle receptor subunit beta